MSAIFFSIETQAECNVLSVSKASHRRPRKNIYIGPATSEGSMGSATP